MTTITFTVPQLDSVITMLHDRHPEFSQEEIAELVGETYEELASHARITAHLVPLTQNHCRRVLDGHKRKKKAS